jgi:uncharacterized protein YjiK
MRKAALMLTLSAALLCFCQQPASNSNFIYHLGQPDDTYKMPEILEEISGITLLNDTIMLCIQDENGVLFYYDLKNRKLQKQIRFGNDADYEDLAMVGDDVFVLQSNGDLHQIKDFNSEKAIITSTHKTALKRSNDCEGLCYDVENNGLLVALKEEPEIGPSQNFDGFRAVYSFDLVKNQLSNEPAILIPLSKQPAAENATSGSDENHIKFHPSAIEIHPLTGDIYVLASKGKALIVMNRQGEIIAYEKLRKKIFPQPEGMAFAPDGTLYISNEGSGEFGNILKFEIKPPQ